MSITSQKQVSHFQYNIYYYIAWPDWQLFSTLESDLRIAAVIGSDNSSNRLLEPLLTAMLEQINAQGCHAEVYVGACYADPDRLHNSYVEALFKYNYDLPPADKIHFYRMESTAGAAILYPQAELNSLRQNLTSGKYQPLSVPSFQNQDQTAGRCPSTAFDRASVQRRRSLKKRTKCFDKCQNGESTGLYPE